MTRRSSTALTKETDEIVSGRSLSSLTRSSDGKTYLGDVLGADEIHGHPTILELPESIGNGDNDLSNQLLSMHCVGEMTEENDGRLGWGGTGVSTDVANTLDERHFFSPFHASSSKRSGPLCTLLSL